VCAAGLTGVEFQPVLLELGELRTLKAKTHLCPGYVWGRVTGILLVVWERTWERNSVSRGAGPYGSGESQW
jgi:hypothetical protein